MEECLAYFRKLIHEPQSVPPWSEWWVAQHDLIERSFDLFDYVRIKHRRLTGAVQILQRRGELPPDYTPRSPLETGRCGGCGDPTTVVPGPGGGIVDCVNCGVVLQFDTPPE